jgi:3-vinyl bacteriochlorophyllide hydratase
VNAKTVTPLYTPEQRQRRDQSVWTLVQGILAPLQFLTFLVSLYLVADALFGQGRSDWANASVLVKTGLLYAIMVTGSIWEKVVFDCYLFAPAFFWEDVVSMGVMVLHTAYVVAWWLQALEPGEQLWLALMAYASYVINAAQFLYKFRQARQLEARLLAESGPDAASMEPNVGQFHGGHP